MNRRRFPSPQPLAASPYSRGFSLLEVILALAILAGSMAVLGQLVQLGMTHARAAEDMTQAVIACESIMAEIVCGARTETAAYQSPYDAIVDEDGKATFVYSVVVAPSSQHLGMQEVLVIVERDPSSALQPVSSELVRWMVDPEYAASLSETTAN